MVGLVGLLIRTEVTPAIAFPVGMPDPRIYGVVLVVWSTACRAMRVNAVNAAAPTLTSCSSRLAWTATSAHESRMQTPLLHNCAALGEGKTVEN